MKLITVASRTVLLGALAIGAAAAVGTGGTAAAAHEPGSYLSGVTAAGASVVSPGTREGSVGPDTREG